MTKLGENKINLDIFKRKFRQKNFSSDSSTHTLSKFKNLSREIQFITAGYFDFDSMIWKDRIDDQALSSTQWYQKKTHYVRQGYTLVRPIGPLV